MIDIRCSTYCELPAKTNQESNDTPDKGGNVKNNHGTWTLNMEAICFHVEVFLLLNIKPSF